MKKEVNFIDLFSGIGGFHQALSGLGARCVLASEIDEKAVEVYLDNYRFNSFLDINKINGAHLLKLPKKIHFLTAGFPCQSFSNAGKKEGFDDPQNGKLIYCVSDIIKLLKSQNKKPQVIILENVKHLASHNDGKTLVKIKKIFQDLDYSTTKNSIILSPHQIGIPQHRPRIIIPFICNSLQNQDLILQDLEKINMRKNAKLQDVNTFMEDCVHPKYFLKNKYILKVFSAWEEFVQNVQRPKNRTLPVIWLDEFGKNYSLDEFKPWRQKYIQDMRVIYANNKVFIDSWSKKWRVHSWKKRDKKLEWQAGSDNFDFKKSFIQLRQSGIRCRTKKMFPSLVAMVQIPILYDLKCKKFRYITPREAANIQSFPKEFKLAHSDFFAYKQFGNAVNVKVVKLISKIIWKWLVL